jgi:hypothetical protein
MAAALKVRAQSVIALESLRATYNNVSPSIPQELALVMKALPRYPITSRKK